MKCPLSWYEGDTLEVAKRLLGQRLVHIVEGKRRSGLIVEVEAYKGPDDKAAHSYKNRRTERTEVMFGPPGHAYVYFIYGMYHCFNIITAPVGIPQGVLIRALEPHDGVEEMSLSRFGKRELTKQQYKNLTSGPGKLCKAMEITMKQKGLRMDSEELFLELVPEEEQLSNKYEIVAGPRIGIDYAEEAVDFPWRFYFQKHPFISK